MFLFLLFLSIFSTLIGSIPYDGPGKFKTKFVNYSAEGNKLWGPNFLRFEFNFTTSGSRELFICYESSLERVKPHMKLRNLPHNNITKACEGTFGEAKFGVGIWIEIEVEVPWLKLEYSFTNAIDKEILNISLNNFTLELPSLLILWNVEKLRVLKEVNFFKGIFALQKTTSKWLLPLDWFPARRLFILEPTDGSISVQNITAETFEHKWSISIQHYTPETTTTESSAQSLSSLTSDFARNSTILTSKTTETTTMTTTTMEPECAQEECVDQLARIQNGRMIMDKERCDIPKDEKEIPDFLTKSDPRMCFDEDGPRYNGDLVLTVGLAQKLLDSTLERCFPNVKASSMLTVHTWNLPIHYRFEASNYEGFLPPFKRAVEDILEIIRKQTCIEFVEHDGNTDIPYLEFTPDAACFSNLGRVVTRGPQKIGLNLIGVDILRQILHALGISYEHLRVDRDEYVQIGWNNMITENRLKFDKIWTEQFGLPYDYGSIMHFPPDHYNVDENKYSIITKQPEFQHTIGQNKLSFKDIKLLNKLYKCEKFCSSTPTTCHNGGFPNPKDCTKCICPTPFSGFGPNCENTVCRIETAKPAEGKTELLESNREGTTPLCVQIEPPNKSYKIAIRIHGIIKLAENKNCKMTCQGTFVEVKAQPDKTSSGARFCCKEMFGEPVEIVAEPGQTVFVMSYGVMATSYSYSSIPAKSDDLN